MVASEIEILERAGFEIHGRRANCPYCEGHRKLTVALTEEGLWYCHRCQKGGTARSLAREQGRTVPLPRVKKSLQHKAEFREWLRHKRHELSAEEHTLTRSVHSRYALALWQIDPENETLWNGLAQYYERKVFFDAFWEAASDKVGRYWLYRQWRRHAQ